MTTPLRSGLLHDDPGELIAAIPGLLRFTPTDSLVLITYADAGGPLRLEAVLRVDLPVPEHVADVASQLRLVALNHDAAAVELVVLGGGDTTPEGPPHRKLVDELAETFDRAGVVCAHAIWAPAARTGETWWCYEDPQCGGRVLDPATSPVTATLSVAGGVTFTSRAELAAQLAPDPDDVLTRRAGLLAAMPAVDPVHDFPFLRDTVDSLDAGDDLALDDGTIVRLAHALSDVDIRESCLAFALTVRAPAAEKLWIALTRASPVPTRAEPASQLAVCAYLRGEGTLAGVAADAALAANPHHGLANTVRQIMDVGLPPHKFRTLLSESFIAAYANRAFTPAAPPSPAPFGPDLPMPCHPST